MSGPIVSGNSAGLKRPGRRVALAIALLAGALIAGIALREPARETLPVAISAQETLAPREISIREIIGQPAGAPSDSMCLQTYEVRPVDPAARFSHEFTINFTVQDAPDGAVAARLENGQWREVEFSRPWFSDVAARVRTKEPGIYSLIVRP